MMETLRPRLRAIGDRIDAMSLRERAIIFVALLAGVYLTADQMVLKPLGIERDRMQLQLKTRHEQIQSYERQLQVMLTGTDDPGSPVAQKILALQQQLSTLDDILSKSTGGLVSPRDMARLCSHDPVCGGHDSRGHGERYLHGAACHGCLFVSETSCERPPGAGRPAWAGATTSGRWSPANGETSRCSGSTTWLMPGRTGIRWPPWCSARRSGSGTCS